MRLILPRSIADDPESLIPLIRIIQHVNVPLPSIGLWGLVEYYVGTAGV